ncbi:MAG: hypothetical protein ACR2RF_03625 [Geminicoccaceae bacterium]
MTRAIGIALGLMLGFAVPLCAKERAWSELVIIHLDENDNETGRQAWLYLYTHQCEIKRIQILVRYWQAVQAGSKIGMKAICLHTT